ncbi:TPA: hypothetical protein ACXLHC_004960 [Klebsiella pneumoniae]
MKRTNPASLIVLIELLERKKANIQKRIDTLTDRLHVISPQFSDDIEQIEKKVRKLKAETTRILQEERS